jgi:hypothetical protein
MALACTCQGDQGEAFRASLVVLDMHKGMRKHIHAVRLELRNLPRTRVAASGEDWVGPCGRGAEGGVAKGGTFACIAFHYKAKWQRLAKHLPLYCA